MHPYVIGELSMGNLHDRTRLLHGLGQMDQALKADDVEVFGLIEANRLFGSGIGWVDAHLLASALLTDDVTLWTRDRRLNAAAERLGCAAQLHH
jgi:predicted nucleic acid-binding protein